MIAPDQISTATPDQLSPILLRLLECPTALLPDLSSQCATAISDLPDDSRPETYEGLLDVARFCIEEEPGWEIERRAQFVGGHPRIGAPLTAPTSELSEESRKEQMKGGQADSATLERLARLNAIYEARYPGLRFVTYVAGRSRAAVADELESILGPKLAALTEAAHVSSTDVRKQESEEWQSELSRASDALWEIAIDRATKLVKSEMETPQQNDEARAPSTALTDNGASNAVAQDVPFLSLATFRMLVLSSPVLESFFKTDLTESFYLESVERSQSGGAYAWHTAPNLPGAPRAVPGASKEGAWTTSEASYSRDVTTGARGKVVGFLGNLLGEEGKAKMNQIADQVGQRLQTHTVTGPKPSFGRNSTLDGSKMDTQELREKEAEERKRLAEDRKNTLGSRLVNALRPPSKASSGGDLRSDEARSTGDDRGRTLNREPSLSKEDKRAGLRGTDLSTAGPKAAAEALRAAQEALLQERPAFVIDEVDAQGEEEEGDDEVEESADQEFGDVVEESSAADEAEGLLKGRDAQMAKELRSAPTQ